jgi:hypothetical protein
MNFIYHIQFPSIVLWFMSSTFPFMSFFSIVILEELVGGNQINIWEHGWRLLITYFRNIIHLSESKICNHKWNKIQKTTYTHTPNQWKKKMMKLIANKGGSQSIHIYLYYCTLAAEETILSFEMLKSSKITSLKNPIFVKYKYLKRLQPLRKHLAENTTFISTCTHYRICSMISILYTSIWR